MCFFPLGFLGVCSRFSRFFSQGFLLCFSFKVLQGYSRVFRSFLVLFLKVICSYFRSFLALLKGSTVGFLGLFGFIGLEGFLLRKSLFSHLLAG